MTALQTIATTLGVAKLQTERIARQALDYWELSNNHRKSPSVRERSRTKFLEYAREAIRLAGVDAVVKYDNARDWQEIINELGREGKMAA